MQSTGLGAGNVSKYLKFRRYDVADELSVPASPVVGLDIGDSLVNLLGESQLVVLAGCCGGADLQHFAMLLDVAEARLGLAEGQTKVICSASDSAKAVLALSSFSGKSSRLAGLCWDRSAFAGDVGCDPASATAEFARVQLVIAARAAGVAAYDCHAGNEAPDAFIRTSLSLGFDGIAVTA